MVDVHGKPLIEIGAFQQLPAQTAALLPTALASAQPQHSELFAEADGHLHLDLVVPLVEVKKGGRQPVDAVVQRLKPEQFLFPFIHYWPTAKCQR